MTLQTIRDSKTFSELKPAIRFLCDEMQKMTWGEFNAFRRVLEEQARILNIPLNELNTYAENYQIFGYELHEAQAFQTQKQVKEP